MGHIANTAGRSSQALILMFQPLFSHYLMGSILSDFQSKGGILAILDETTRFQQGTDVSFVHQLNEKYAGNELYTKAKGDRPEFGIKHFAAQVRKMFTNQ